MSSTVCVTKSQNFYEAIHDLQIDSGDLQSHLTLALTQIWKNLKKFFKIRKRSKQMRFPLSILQISKTREPQTKTRAFNSWCNCNRGTSLSFFQSMQLSETLFWCWNKYDMNFSFQSENQQYFTKHNIKF
jgi:hypothetical protein